MAGDRRHRQLLTGWSLLLAAPLPLLCLLLVEEGQLGWPYRARVWPPKQSLIWISWCHRRLFSSLIPCYFLLILEVNIWHHPVGPLDHQAVPHTGGGEGGVDAGGTGALVAVGQETWFVRTEAEELVLRLVTKASLLPGAESVPQGGAPPAPVVLVFGRPGPCSSSRLRSTDILPHSPLSLSWARDAKYLQSIDVAWQSLHYTVTTRGTTTSLLLSSRRRCLIVLQ